MSKHFNILNEHGFEYAMLGLSLNKNQEPSNMPKVANRLAPMDKGHSKFLESIVVWLDIKGTQTFHSQLDTYRVGITKQSQSKMHTILKKPLSQEDFLRPVYQETIDRLNKAIERKSFEEVINNLPMSFMQRRIICTNYKTLRNMYQQRKNHKLGEWKEFCTYIRDNLQYGHWLD